MNHKTKYILSFTAASLRLNEMIKVAGFLLDPDNSNNQSDNSNTLSFKSGKSETSRRVMRELNNRLKKLTALQLEALVNGDFITQKQMAFLAVCKHYHFIHDFVVEVIRDKTLLFNYQLSDVDFKIFINNKIELHPELEAFTDTTMKKTKQVLFLILAQAGIINNTKDKSIQPQILNKKALEAIAADNPNWLRVFLISDNDMKHIKI